ncbi:23S rRNA (adenine(2503)-C(2))-methyltransferase RlmN [Egicoccus sp. AB-alg2]|uniref:23S rRNA (adenine(2503)-C(2))-methyltransferase RlmN n=1 Tax=Egicoccus sp. AB-alg2 TaxID=3242693 RepID=UPI00359EC756
MRTTRPRTSVYDLSFEEVAEHLGVDEASTVFHQLYRERRRHSPELDRLCRAAGLPHVAPLTHHGVDRGNRSAKYLFGLADGNAIEAVRIRRRTGVTACVSSQVGCAFGCTFCASGRLGLRRQLRSGEIVQQVLELGRDVNRLVFMGIGEPLHNYDEVLRAIRVLRDRRGLGLRTSGVTISSIGLPNRLRRLREEHLAINLTISLHATTDEVRHQLIPGARAFSIDDVVTTSQAWATRHRRPVTYVYLLLPGVNDTRDDADRLVRWFRHRHARVNLMRWNPVLGGPRYARVDDHGLAWFKRHLVTAGVPTVVRDTQGRDIDAACGQLWLRDVRR